MIQGSFCRLAESVFCVAILHGGALAASATPAPFFEDFDSENRGVGVAQPSSLSEFEIVSGSVDLIGNGFFDFYPSNGLYLDLNGGPGPSGTIESKRLFEPGLYRLAFTIGNNPMPFPSANPTEPGTENTVTVSFGSYSESFSRFGVVPLDSLSRSINLTNASRLRFETPESDTNRAGILLMSVGVTSIPEPTTASLGTIGLVALIVSSRRSSRRLAGAPSHDEPAAC